MNPTAESICPGCTLAQGRVNFASFVDHILERYLNKLVKGNGPMSPKCSKCILAKQLSH